MLERVSADGRISQTAVMCISLECVCLSVCNGINFWNWYAGISLEYWGQVLYQGH